MAVTLTKTTYYVNVYRVERVYGGPEEGGWWYDMREILRSTPCVSEEEAEALAEIVRLSGEYPETRHRFSVCPRGEDYEISVEDERGTDDEPRFYC